MMHHVDVKDLKVNYGVVGEGHPVIFLHGNPADHRSMMSAFEPIFVNHSGWQRHYLDLPGMGGTKGAEWIKSNDDMLQMVLALIEKVIPNKRFSVVGESYGGYLARGIAHYKADLIDGMFLLSPLVKPETKDRQIPQKQIIYSDKHFVESLPEEMQIALGEVATVHTQEIAESLLKDYISAMQMSDQAFLTKLRERYKFSFDLDQPSLHYDFPALIIAGRQDIIVGYADQLEIYKFFTRCTLAILDRAGHVSELEQRELFNVLTHDWLNRVEEEISNRERK